MRFDFATELYFWGFRVLYGRVMYAVIPRRLRERYKGVATREQFVARYAALLVDAPEQQQRIRNQQAEIGHLDYNWRLNDRR